MTAIREIHFRERRPPHEIQFELERLLMVLLAPAVEESFLTYRADVTVNGLPHRFQLRFEAALLFRNCYSFQAELLLDTVPVSRHESEQKSFSSWFDFWTHNYKSSDAPTPGAGSVSRYESLSEEALAAESRLIGVADVQQAILKGLRKGASFSTGHKEGGTTIRFSQGHFVRAEFGESGTTEKFDDETAFLAFLRQFYDWETSRHSFPERVPDYQAWKLILRLLRPAT